MINEPRPFSVLKASLPPDFLTFEREGNNMSVHVHSYQLLPDDILLLIVEADFTRNGKPALPKWRLVNSNCCRLASRSLFKNLRLNFSSFLPSQKFEAARALHLLQCLDTNPDIARVVKQLTLEGSFEVDENNDEM